MDPTATVTVRMYHVGFGDAFLVTVRNDSGAWRMLVDCGVHSQGQVRPMAEVVSAIVADLTAQAPPGEPPRLDVLVATHRHADHISGFALDAWQAVAVGEVWLAFVHDETDPDGIAVSRAQERAATQLRELIAAVGGPRRSEWAPELLGADAFAVNSSGNAAAMQRLLGKGLSFQNTPPVRFLPDRDPARNVIDTDLPGVRVHVLGPPRDAEHLRRMDPPASVAWLHLHLAALSREPGRGPLGAPRSGSATPGNGALDQAPPDGPLFHPAYVVPADQVGPELDRMRVSLNLRRTADESEALLAAGAALENAVNNTSVFLVLDVQGTRLVFPGDAQQGGWEHVLDDPASRALVTHPAFYKIGHHGSHNATPRPFVEEELGEGAYAMLPWALVRRWQDSIPKATLMAALAEHNTQVIRMDAPVRIPGVTVHEDMWSEVTLSPAQPSPAAAPPGPPAARRPARGRTVAGAGAAVPAGREPAQDAPTTAAPSAG